LPKKRKKSQGFNRLLKRIKIVEQAGIDAYTARVFFLAAVGLEGRAVSKCSASANRTKMRRMDSSLYQSEIHRHLPATSLWADT